MAGDDSVVNMAVCLEQTLQFCVSYCVIGKGLRIKFTFL